jgi:SAM-dependent methyltransferase
MPTRQREPRHDGDAMSEPARQIPREAGRSLFGADPAAYDAARPPYPGRVFEILAERRDLRSASALEIGPGTGLASRRVANQGLDRLVAVEPDATLASYLRETWSEKAPIEVIVQAFEDAVVGRHTFDLAFAATSFHWVDPEIGLAKVRDALRPDGLWAMFWNVFGDPDRPDPFHDATRSVLEPLESSPSGRPDLRDSVLDVDAQISRLSAAAFVDVDVEVLRWTLSLDSAGTRALYATYSAINRLDTTSRTRVLDEVAFIAEREFGGRVERNMVTAVYTARPDER